MSERVWTDYTQKNPCPRCGAKKRCGITEEGVEICYGAPTVGGNGPKTGRLGEYYTYAPAGSRPKREATRATVAQAVRASTRDLSRVYSALLDQTGLSKDQRQRLLARGYPADYLKTRRFGLLPDHPKQRIQIARDLEDRFGTDLFLSVPGLCLNTSRFDPDLHYPWINGWAGLLIPVLSRDGEIVALVVRSEHPDAPRYSYLSSSSKGGPKAALHVHHPPFAGSTDVIRCTEGPIKGDLATLHTGILTLAVPGCSTWESAMADIKALAPREVLLAFDMDARAKREVGQSLRDFAEALHAEGYTLALETWDPAFNGIDDALSAGAAIHSLRGPEMWTAINALAAGTKPMNATASTVQSTRMVSSTNTHTPVPRGTPTPEEAATLAESLVADVEREKSVPAVFSNVPLLAQLDNATYAAIVARIRTALGKSLNLNHLEAAVREERRKLRSPTNASRSHLPAITVNDRQFRHVVGDALATLQEQNDPPYLYQRGGTLVQTGTNERDEPIIRTVEESEMRIAMSRAADYYATTQDGTRAASPPREVAQGLLALGQWPFPALVGITETPIIRPDGSILSEPGYDAATRMLYVPAPGLVVPPIPDLPTEADIQAAYEAIADILHDFPFALDDKTDPQGSASWANAWATFLTAIIRQIIRGPVPMGVADAPRAGTGKGLFMSLVSAIPTGRPGAVTTAPTKEDEWRKTITTHLLDGASLIIFDNVEEPLASPSLAAALTSDIWTDRLLSTNKRVSLPQRATWLATGNNIQLGGDIPRRTYRIRLDAKMARPWERTEFRHKNLIGWVLEHRGELLAALLTIVRAWFVAGQPLPKQLPTVMGGFEHWCHTIGGILEFVGIRGFLGNQEELWDQADEEAIEWGRLLAILDAKYNGEEFTVASVAFHAHESSEFRTALPDDLSRAFGEGDATFSRKLGWALKRHVDTRYGTDGFYIARGDDDSHRKVATWKILRGFSSAETENPAAYRHRSGVCGFSSLALACKTPPPSNGNGKGEGGIHVDTLRQNPQNPAVGTNPAGFHSNGASKTPQHWSGEEGEV